MGLRDAGFVHKWRLDAEWTWPHSETGPVALSRGVPAANSAGSPAVARTWRMRACFLLVVTTFLMLASGCQRTPNPITAGSASIGPAGVEPAQHELDPLTRNPEALQDGRRLFGWYNCSGCHGTHGGGAMGPSLRDRVWLYGSGDGQIYASIAQGRPDGMPAWGAKIPQIQIWELVAYIKSMRTPQEPEPPVEPTSEETPNPMNDTVLGIGTQTNASEIVEPSGAASTSTERNPPDVNASGSKEPK